MPVPDVTGQPAWVVVVLAILGALSVIGVAWLGSRRDRNSPPPAGGEQGTLPEGTQSATDHTGQVLQTALDHLAKVAEREALESEVARRETAALREKLETMMAELQELRARAARAEQDLAACRAHAEDLSRQALRRGDYER